MSSSVEVFMARQPIYGRETDLYAYELLFRQHNPAEAGSIDREKAATALVSSLVDIGLNELIGNTRAFINVNQELLMSQAVTMLPKERVVIEILETVEPLPEVVERLRTFKEYGFIIALDDYVPTSAGEAFLPYADIVKLDVLGLTEAQLRSVFRATRNMGAKILAERVETREKYQLCYKLGFDLFQGYFFAKPQLVKGYGLKTNQLSMLRLAAKLQSPNLAYQELEEIISADVSLSYRLLKFVKSAYFGVQSVGSVKQALLFLGVNLITSLATLLAMSGSSEQSDELLRAALIRAKMCELLANQRRLENADRYFTAGMLSLLDAIMDLPMELVVRELPLEPELNEALLNPESPNELALMLRAVTAFERGDWDRPLPCGLTAGEVSKAYHAAVCWSGKALMAA